MIDINKAIATTMRTGKAFLGAKNTVKNAKIGKVKLVIVAANCPENVHKDIEYYCRLSNIPLVTFSGTSIDLGVACGKPFMVSALAVREAGDSDILKLAEEADV
ncbi:MAG: 50S ribosomal protein L30e [Candidatus Bathyarchaeia archaeon]